MCQLEATPTNFLPRCSTDVRKYFFSQHIVKIWNKLPVYTDFSNIESFKRTLDGFNLMLIVTFNTRFTVFCFVSRILMALLRGLISPETANEPIIDVLFYFVTF